ncbi:MAG TPA: TonB-dependent receptor [Cytophagaceae bacterium]|nr:TonB-dependent receptor [Cytophagaceae bacterium]
MCLFLLFVSQRLSAQDTGGIEGVIVDSTEALAGAVVVVEGNNKLSGITDIEGNFVLKNVPPGNYNIIVTYFGYTPYTIKDIKVEAGKSTKVGSVILTEVTTEHQEIIVVGKKNEGSEMTAVQDTKKSEKIISVLSTEQIQKGQDRDAAEAIRRIPGVTLVDSRFIMIRGLAERYNSVWLNDAGAPSSETDSKAFSFDIIPSQLIDKIQVYKTSAPDLPGDFAGGMVKVYTRASASEKNLQVTLQGSFRPGSTFGNFSSTGGGGPLDLLGFGSHYRQIPTDVPGNLNTVSSLDQRNSISQSFDASAWNVKSNKAAPDGRLNIFYTDRFKMGRTEVGNTLNINYANLHTIFKIHREDWDSTSKTKDYSDVQSTNTARLGIVENMYFRFNDRFKIEVRQLFNQIGVQQNTLRTSNLSNQQEQRAYALSYQSRSVYSSQLTGDVESKSGKVKYDWSGGFSHINRSTPDLRRIKYTKPYGSPDSAYTAQVPPGTADPVNGGGRFYSTLNENVFSLNQNLKHMISKREDLTINMNYGAYLEYKSRSFSARTFGYVITPSATSGALTRLPIDQIFSSQYVGVPNGFRVDEITSLSDAYTAQNGLIAPYISFSSRIIEKVNILTGVRFEHNKQSLQSYLNSSKLDTSVTTNFFLPSVNLSYNFTKKSLLRVAYGRTLNRPEFREWSPFYFYNFEYSAGTYGSLFPTVLSPRGQVLQVCKINNFDLRYEFYPSADELINIGVFYKHLENPIQQVVLNGTDDSRNFSFANAQWAYIAGVELDLRKNLGFLGNSKLLKDLNLVSNASLIKSKVTNTNVINQNVSTPLQGQSPYVINAGLYYQNEEAGWQGSLLYNVFGPRIFIFGTKNYPSYIEMPKNSLDLTVGKRISKRVSVNGGVQDLLNQAALIIQDTNGDGKYERPSAKASQEDQGADRIISKYKRGSYFTLGVKINL